MPRTRPSRRPLVSAALLLTAAPFWPTASQEARAGTRATGPTAQTAVAYVAVGNRGTAPDRLVSASSRPSAVRIRRRWPTRSKST